MNGSRLAALALMALSAPVIAHNRVAGSFDEHTVVMIEGTVKEFWWRNPHSALVVIGKDEAGNPRTYALQLGAPKALVDRGMSKQTFKPGDQVKIRMNPALKNPATGLMLEEYFWVNGKEIHELGEPQDKKY
jgi:hypothetical protein